MTYVQFCERNTVSIRVQTVNSANSFFDGIHVNGDDRARTDNPRLAKPVISQLSYVPESEQGTGNREQNIQNCSLIAVPCSTEVGVPGLEPGTSALSELRSNQLSYTP